MTDVTVQKKQVFPLFLVLIVVIVASLTIVAVVWVRPTIETDLLQRARSALSETNLPADSISFQGRDAVLTGIANEEQAQQMVNVVSRLKGVRVVEPAIAPVDQLKTPATDLAMAAAAQATFQNGLFVPQKKYPIEQLDLSGIQFPYAKAELDKHAEALLQNMLVQLQEKPSLMIEISAHTDDSGTALGKIAVTQARADAIKTWLTANGIAAERVVAMGYGSTRPLADNSSEEGKAQNRRIEVMVLKE